MNPPKDTALPNQASLFQRQIAGKNICVIECFSGCGQCQRHSSWYMLTIFGIQLRPPIKATNFSSNLYRSIRNIERLNAMYAAFTVAQRRPKSFPSNPYWRDATHARDYHASELFGAA
jgi:hypothetical protein